MASGGLAGRGAPASGGAGAAGASSTHAGLGGTVTSLGGSMSATAGATPSGGRAPNPGANAGASGDPAEENEAGAGGEAGMLGPAGGAAGSAANGGRPGTGGANQSAAGGGATAAGSGGAGTGGDGVGGTGGTTPSAIQVVFVVALENHDPGEVIGNTTDAPYLNGLVDSYASAAKFLDQFAISTPSEPHYIWMEAGTNEFDDRVFTSDGSPSATNSTADTQHLVTQIAAATSGITWRSYQEGIDDSTGACPIASSGHYAAKHNPFVFFRDVSGDPPSKTNAYCAAHHKGIAALAGDLAAESVATFNFITPDLCHDMHGQTGCPSSNLVRSGDDWLAANLPPVVAYVTSHSGVIFLVWDEGHHTTTMPFVAVGPGTKKGYVSDVTYMHGSLLKSVERILGLPVLPRVSSDNDLGDLFEVGKFP